MATKHQRRWYDVWWSDGNDRNCIGAVSVRKRSSVERDQYNALDRALAVFPAVPDQWEEDGSGGTYLSVHESGCECSCHSKHYPACSVNITPTSDEVECDCDGMDCGECGMTYSISLEPCDEHGFYHAYHHSDARSD